MPFVPPTTSTSVGLPRAIYARDIQIGGVKPLSRFENKKNFDFTDAEKSISRELSYFRNKQLRKSFSCARSVSARREYTRF